MAEEQQDFVSHADDDNMSDNMSDNIRNDDSLFDAQLESSNAPLYNAYTASSTINASSVISTNLIDNDISGNTTPTHPLQQWVKNTNTLDTTIPDLSGVPNLMGCKLITVGTGAKGSAGNAVFYKTKPDDGNPTSKPRQFTVVMSNVDIAGSKSKKNATYYDVTGSLDGDYTSVLAYLANDTRNMYNSLGNNNASVDIRTPVFNSTNGGMAFQVRVHETCKTKDGKVIPSIKIYSLTTKDEKTYSTALKHTDEAYLNYHGDMTVTFTLDTLIVESNRCRLVATAKALALKSTNTRNVMGYNTIIARDDTGLGKHLEELSKVVTRPDQKNHMNNILALLTQVAISGSDLGQVYSMISSVNRTPVYQDNTDKKIVANNIVPMQRRQQAPNQHANQAMTPMQAPMVPQPMMQQQPMYDAYNQEFPAQQQFAFSPYGQGFQQQQYQQPNAGSYGQPRYARKG